MIKSYNGTFCHGFMQWIDFSISYAIEYAVLKNSTNDNNFTLDLQILGILKI
jgi:hypothetical protein